MDEIREEAKEVICTILAAAGGELHRKIALFTVFYYAHLYYWQEFGKPLTDHPIVRMPQGPGIEDHIALFAELEAEGKIKVCREAFGPFQEYVYVLNTETAINPNDSRYRAIERALKWIEGKSATEISEEVRDYSRSWQLAHDGDELNIYIDLFSDEEYADMKQRFDEVEAMVNKVFSEIG